MSFINCLENETNKTAFTENGALSYKSTLNPVLDFFSKSGAIRGQTDSAYNLFMKAFKGDETLSKRALFYSRDVRGGQGERKNFRHIINKVAKYKPEALKKNIPYISFFGRWDDLYSLIGTPLENDALEFMKIQFDEDMNKIKDTEKVAHVSLLGKWLKSENTSSFESKKLGKLTRKYFKLSPKEYRQSLTKLRKAVEVVECKMCSGDWDKINYEHVSSNAMKIYSKAFKKHDECSFGKYLEKVKSGEAKIHSDTLYPYDIVDKYLNGLVADYETLEELWKHLPNYFEDSTNSNCMCVVDTSGSMYSGCSKIKPINVAISLGLYMAERNKGAFENTFITFSSNPELMKIQGNTLKDKIDSIKGAHWGNNTDLIKVFDLLVNTIKKYNIPENERPSKLFIISDMQFDCCCNGSKTNFEAIDKMYQDANIKRPDLIFWNVNAYSDTPVVKDENGTFLVSGASPSILKYALNTKTTNPYDMMLEVLNSSRYQVIE